VSALASEQSPPAELRLARWSSLRRLIADPLGLLGLLLVLLIVLAAALSPWISPYDPNHISIMERLKPPSTAHWLGTDQLGRDLLSRVLVGSRIALLVAGVTIGLSLAGGIALGLLAGYGPRWLDAILVLLFDSIRSFPTVMFGLAVVTILGPSLNTIMVIIIVFSVPGYARIVRTQTMSLKGTEFVMAERSLGAGMVRVLTVHILPNLIGPLLILASMDIPSVITIEAGLSFLGLGVRAPLASWGSILNDGYSFIRDTDWLVIAAGVPLVLATLGFTFLGESLRDIFDPRLRKDL
jgi:peptide/nickel transport system permease protein